MKSVLFFIVLIISFIACGPEVYYYDKDSFEEDYSESLDNASSISEIDSFESLVNDTSISVRAATGGKRIVGMTLEEAVSGNAYRRAISIAVDSKNQPHIVSEYNNSGGLFAYHKINGRWIKQEPLVTINGDSGGGLRPIIKIDSSDRAWVSFSAVGGATMSNFVGLIQNASTNPQRFSWYQKTSPYNGFIGVLAIDPYYPNNAYHQGDTKKSVVGFDINGNRRDLGVFANGGSGEKVAFEISPRSGQAGVWHSAMGGYYKDYSSYRNSLMSSRVTWAGKGYMGQAGNDGAYVDVGIDLTNPKVAYIVSSYGGVSINIWTGSKMLFSKDKIYRVSSKAASFGNGARRFSPQWAPALNGGAFLCWTSSSGKIMLKYVNYKGTSYFSNNYIVTSGSQCDIATDSEGNLHMVYNNGGMKYRKIKTGN